MNMTRYTHESCGAKLQRLSRIMTVAIVTMLSMFVGSIDALAESETLGRASDKDVDVSGTSCMVPGTCVAGGGNASKNIKMRTNQSLASYGVDSGTGFYMLVNSGYYVTSVTLDAVSNSANATQLVGVYVDGSSTNVLGNTTYSLNDKNGDAVTIEITGFVAASSIAFKFDNVAAQQVNMTVTVNYATASIPTVSVPSSVNTKVNRSTSVAADIFSVPSFTSLQWYSNTIASNSGGTLISGATDSTYTYIPTTDGTEYYYCVVTNSEGTVTSDVCTVTVEASPPDITTDLSTASTAVSGRAKTLSIAASNVISYQWYTCDDANGTNPVAIESANSSSYTIASPVDGSYYYVKAINNAGETQSVITCVSVGGHTFDFTSWSSTTLGSCASDTQIWSTHESADMTKAGNDGDKGYYNDVTWNGTVLTAGSANVRETYPLSFNGGAHGIGLIYNLPSTKLGTYASSQYLWLLNTNTYFTIPNVRAGSTIYMGVESHKIEEARGVTVTFSDDTYETFTTGEFADHAFVVPSASSLGSDYTDVRVQCAVKGSHVYYVDCEYNDFTLLKDNLRFTENGVTYALTSGVDYSTTSTAALTFVSSDESVATVSASGVITTVGNGSATITITLAAHDGMAALSKTITVNVASTAIYSFSTDDAEVKGVLPSGSEVEKNTIVTLPYSPNRLAYKEGYTLSGWNDGTDTYALGASYTVTEDVEFTPVFTANTKGLTALTKNTAVRWEFGPKNGAPKVAWENSGDQYLVTQSDVEGETQDMPLIVNTNGGKFNNFSRSDNLAQVNDGTKFTFRAVSGMTIELTDGYSNPSATISDGSINTSMTLYGSSLVYTYVGRASEVTITVGGGGYYSGLTLTYPRLPIPEITSDLASRYNARTGISKTLNVGVSGATSYQWYSNTEASTEGATAIAGANSPAYTISEPAEGVYYYLVATNSHGSITSTITTLKLSAHTFDFTDWSSDTKANLAADNRWTLDEKNDGTGITSGAYFTANTASYNYEYLTANGVNIAETYPIRFTVATGFDKLALAYDLGTALSSYSGNQYIWLAGDDTYMYIPAVKAGSTIKIGVESHQLSDGRGVIVKYKDAQGNWQLIGTEMPTTLTECTFEVPAAATMGQDITEISIQNSGFGSHVYYIDCDMAGFTINNSNYVVKPGETYTLEEGNDYVNFSKAPITWTSSNTNVATVSSDGTITVTDNGVVTVTASQEANGVYHASEQTFTVSTSNAQISVVAEPSSLVITSDKVKSATSLIALTGTEFPSYGDCSVSVNGASSNISISPQVFQIESDGTIAQQFTVTYTGTAVSAERTLTITFTAAEHTATISLPYGRTVAYSGTAVEPVNTYRKWDWNGASSDVLFTQKEGYMKLSDVEIPSGVSIPSGLTDAEGYYGGLQYLAGAGQYVVQGGGQCFQGNQMYFNNTVSGMLEVEFSNTGSSQRPYRYLNVNGVNTEFRSNSADKVTATVRVAAGGVLLQGRYADEEGEELTDSINFGPQYLRIYKITFTPDADAPEITLNNDKASFVLTNGSSDDKFYYTLDGTEPDEMTGLLYVPNLDGNGIDQGIHVSGNCVIKAVAANTQKTTSEVSEKQTHFKTYKLNAHSWPDTYGILEFSPVVQGNNYTAGTEVTMTAVAKPGYGFTGWSTDKTGENPVSSERTYTVTINSTSNVYYAHFEAGPQGTVVYDVMGARWYGSDGVEYTEKYADTWQTTKSLYEGLYNCTINSVEDYVKYAVTMGIPNYSVFPERIVATAINVPSNHTLHVPNYTLLYWEDKDTHTRYELGSSEFFASEGQTVTLIPVFKYNCEVDKIERVTEDVTIHWDFRTGYGAQRMDNISGISDLSLVTKTEISGQGVRNDDTGEVENQTEDIDVALTIDTSVSGAVVENTDIDTWAYIKEGTKITIPSGYGAVVTLATYAPINDEASSLKGTRLNGMMPDNIYDENLKRNSDNAYLYYWTVKSTDITATLNIGDDYAYYQYIEVALPTAVRKTLYSSSNNTGMGTVALSTEGGQKTTDGGTAFINGTSVTINANRNKYYELMYWQEGNGTRIYPDGSYQKAGSNTRLHTDWNGTGSFSTGGTVTYSAVSDESITLQLNDYHTLQAVYGKKKSYYVNFSAGGQADGLPPYQQHVEWDEKFVMPEHNQHLYLEGYTLDYYTDIKGNHYDFGQEYLVNEANTVDGDLLLSPHFVANTVARGQVSEATTIEWPLGAARGATAIYYSSAAGLIVDQLNIGGTKIDLPLRIDGSKGSVTNSSPNSTTAESSCTANKNAVFTLPVSSNCVIELHSDNGAVKNVSIAGTTNYTTSSDGGKTVSVVYTGEKAMEEIDFGAATRMTYVKVTYNPIGGQPELTGVTIDGTSVNETQLTTLKTAKALENVEFEARYSGNSMPVLAISASNGGKGVITQATSSNPVAKILLQTAGGVTVATYSVSFRVTGTVAPEVTSITVDGKNAMDGSATEVNTKGVIAIALNHVAADATLAATTGLGQQLKAVVSNKTLRFTYWDLEYGKDYSLTIPAGTLKDTYGEAYNQDLVVAFSTRSSSASVSPRKFDFVVTHNQDFDCATQTAGRRIQIVENDVIANLDSLNVPHGTLDEGLALANADGGSERFYIFVPDGEYCMKGAEKYNGTYKDNKDGVSAVVNNFYNGQTWIKRNNVSLVGQSQDGTLIYSDPYIYGISWTNTLGVSTAQKDCYFQDFTVENRYSDFQVERGDANPGGQSVAVYDRGIHSIWKNVTMKGYQDTYASASNTSSTQGTSPGFFHTYCYYENCQVWGTVDFICGSGESWWENPVLVLRKRATGNNIVASSHQSALTTVNYVGADKTFDEKWGFVFNKAVIKCESVAAHNAQNGNYTIGRTWQGSPSQTFLYATYQSMPQSVGYGTMYKNLLCRMHEYGSMNADGTVADLTGRTLRNATPAAGSDDCILTAEQAAEYTLHNVLGGDEAYDPTVYTEQVSMAGVLPENSTNSDGSTIITWTAKQKALCYFIFRIDEETGDTLFYTMATYNHINPGEEQAGRRFVIRAANERGGLGDASEIVTYEPLGTYAVEVKQVGPEPGKGWSTVCLPENATFSDVDGLTVYAAVALNGSTLGLKKITGASGLRRKRGYILYATPGTYYFRGTYNTVRPVIQGDSEEKYSLLDGNSENHAVTVGTLNVYTLAYKPAINPGVGFYKFVGSSIPARKAYLQTSTLEAAGITLGAKGLQFTEIVDEEEFYEDATTVSGVKEDTDDVDAVFDLSGKPVDPDQMRKGMIYIIGGQKQLYE